MKDPCSYFNVLNPAGTLASREQRQTESFVSPASQLSTLSRPYSEQHILMPRKTIHCDLKDQICQ